MSQFLSEMIEITGLSTGSWQTKDVSGAPWNVSVTAKGLVPG